MSMILGWLVPAPTSGISGVCLPPCISRSHVFATTLVSLQGSSRTSMSRSEWTIASLSARGERAGFVTEGHSEGPGARRGTTGACRGRTGALRTEQQASPRRRPSSSAIRHRRIFVGVRTPWGLMPRSWTAKGVPRGTPLEVWKREALGGGRHPSGRLRGDVVRGELSPHGGASRAPCARSNMLSRTTPGGAVGEPGGNGSASRRLRRLRRVRRTSIVIEDRPSRESFSPLSSHRRKAVAPSGNSARESAEHAEDAEAAEWAPWARAAASAILRLGVPSLTSCRRCADTPSRARGARTSTRSSRCPRS